MQKLLDNLSNDARQILEQYSNCNLAICIDGDNLPLHVKVLSAFKISVYPIGTMFDDVVFGTSLQKYKTSQPAPNITYTVLLHGDTSDGGTLKGLVKKHSVGGYLYKPFNEIEFHNNDFIKYDYSNKIVKLIEPYSFLKGGGRKF